MLRVGICDDEITTCAELKKMILDIADELGIELLIDIWHSGDTLLKDIHKLNEIDLLFLDIMLPDKDGIDIGKKIRETNNYRILISYISSKKTYAMKLFQNQPIAFLIKPIKKKELKTILETACKRISDNMILFEYKKGRHSYFLNCQDIAYFESTRKKIEVVLTNGDRDAFYGKLTDVSSRLPKYFSLIHRSYIVNRNYVKKYSYDALLMFNDETFPISKLHRMELRTSLQDDKMEGRG